MLRLIVLILSLPFFPICLHADTQTTENVEIIKSKQANPKSMFLTEKGEMTSELINLLTLDNLYNEGETFKEAVKKTNASWCLIYRGLNNKERADLVDPIGWLEIRGSVLKIIEEMGLLQAKIPSSQHYDYAICHGAFMEGVRFRVAQLIEQWNQGIRFDSLVFLTGERTLRKNSGEKDDFATLSDPTKSPFPLKADWIPNPQVKYETEYDMVKIVWEQAAIPESMAKHLEGKVTFVNTPKGDFPRPSMETTYAYWLKEYQPKEGSILAPSHPLIWCYQQLIAASILGQKFKHEAIAPEAPYLTSNRYEIGLTSLIFDTLAKCMFIIDKSIENQ